MKDFLIRFLSKQNRKMSVVKHMNMCKDLWDDITVIANNEPIINLVSKFGINNFIYMTIKLRVTQKNKINEGYFIQVKY